ncbi:MAG: hypothetical protein JJT81_17080 [Rubellimicrobium sp.]|nr:hypothetical protein [Rubellimicrobium sp.]
MSTTGITTWAVDLAEIGAIYPFQGTETLLWIIGVAAWIGWHVWSIRWERNYQREKIAKFGNSETLKRAVEQH